jgi:hypothetical protein
MSDRQVRRYQNRGRQSRKRRAKRSRILVSLAACLASEEWTKTLPALLPAFRQFVYKIKLDMLQFEEPAPLVLAQLIDLGDESSDFEFGFQVNFVILFCPQPVAMLLPVLTHHDYRRLNSGNTGKDQIEQDKWKRIEWCLGY